MYILGHTLRERKRKPQRNGETTETMDLSKPKAMIRYTELFIYTYIEKLTI